MFSVPGCASDRSPLARAPNRLAGDLVKTGALNRSATIHAGTLSFGRTFRQPRWAGGSLPL